jgi:hypothetical protein
MSAAGTFELPLVIAQLAISIGAAWAGMRLVDDIKSLLAWRGARANRD